MSSNNNDQRDQRDQRDRRGYGGNRERYIPRERADDHEQRGERERGRGYGGNRERYIPRERVEDHHRREDREPRRDVYYDDFRIEYGEDVARNMYGEDNTPITHPSICIPRTFISIRGTPTKTAVFNTLRDLKIGFIDRIDVVQKTDARGERYCTIYIHLKWNVRNQLGRDTRKKLLDGNEVKIVYDDPWFWKCTMSTMEKPDRVGGNGGRSAPRPRIDLGDGVRAVSRYTRDEERDGEEEEATNTSSAAATTQDEEESHDQRQLCNMDPNEDSGSDN